MSRGCLWEAHSGCFLAGSLLEKYAITFVIFIYLCEAENYCSVPPLHSFRNPHLQSRSLSLQHICGREVDWTEHFRQTDTC